MNLPELDDLLKDEPNQCSIELSNGENSLIFDHGGDITSRGDLDEAMKCFRYVFLELDDPDVPNGIIYTLNYPFLRSMTECFFADGRYEAIGERDGFKVIMKANKDAKDLGSLLNAMKATGAAEVVAVALAAAAKCVTVGERGWGGEGQPKKDESTEGIPWDSREGERKGNRGREGKRGRKKKGEGEERAATRGRRQYKTKF